MYTIGDSVTDTVSQITGGIQNFLQSFTQAYQPSQTQIPVSSGSILGGISPVQPQGTSSQLTKWLPIIAIGFGALFLLKRH